MRIKSIRFSGAAEPVATDSDLIVVIGPNNGGKSRGLREIRDGLTAGEPGAVVAELQVERTGTEDDLLAWLDSESSPHPAAPGDPLTLRGLGGALIMVPNAKSFWKDEGKLGSLSPFLVGFIDATTRLQLAQSVDSIDPLRGQAVTPLQRLITDHAAERRLSDAVERAFGMPISVSRAGGATVHLLLGRPTAEARLDSPDYLRELQSLPLVPEQGDGMRAYIGLLLAVLAASYPLILIDEPEAFLHPPQARELGRQLAAQVGVKQGAPVGGETPSTADQAAPIVAQQIIVATHSSDVLFGLLDRARSLTVVRLRRQGDRNIPAVLDHERVKELWNDPVLRFSHLLNGLFHRGVVICEAEGDARLYAAALETELESDGRGGSDLLFTHCSGKHKLPRAIESLVAVDVPVAAIADIDVLRDEQLLKRIVEALGEGWTCELAEIRRRVSTAVGSRPVEAPLIADVSDEITKALGEDRTARLTEDQTRRIREITRSSDGWRRVRESGGVGAIPRGDAAAAASQLLTALADVGLFVVPAGMLEGWAAEIGKHGPAFVEAALSTKVHERNLELRHFVLGVANYLRSIDESQAQPGRWELPH